MSRSLAAAYAVKKMGKKSHKADCPGCEMCHGGMMADGGDVEGINKPVGPQRHEDYMRKLGHSGGRSKAGLHVRAAHEGTSPEFNIGKAKEEHEHTLRQMKSMKKPNLYAEGGEVEDDDMISRIMAKRMSEGGVIANEDMPEADFEDAEFDDLEKDDHLEGEYPGSQEIGDEQENEDRRDIVARIMRSRKKKDRIPRTA